MSTAAASPDMSSVTSGSAAAPGPLAPLLAAVVALVAAVLALVDLFAQGLADTVVHLGVGLAVFTAFRLAVGLALTPDHPPQADNSESR
ncbi:hypothetical protein PUR49_32515 [Streptomyces sp. BE147]|uniref:hypothetical protein n=1 Tax=Streptomyces sp. BE147 TaxID=3002524 RepID=UPI002E75D97B|nr:hypothetical protein [Streptomyces sp. BE147]MEE1741196.1 hypothetical protein [Streptomyces sp. BE147]